MCEGHIMRHFRFGGCCMGPEMHFPRHFLSKSERVQQLTQYLEELEAEKKAAESAIKKVEEERE